MKLGIYGGSFDPIHWGHILPVRHAMESLGIDQVLYLPTARPPHKRNRELAPAWCRFAMVELALLDEPRMWVSPHEMESADVSYTVDTLRAFRRERPEAELHLLLGSDAFLGLPGWREWQRLGELARLVVMARPGWRVTDVPPALSALVQGQRVDLVPHTVQVEASSSEIRRRISEGSSGLDDLMPSLVLDYIRKYELYC